MCYRLYAEYDTVAVRTARRYNSLKKAVEVAKTIQAKVVYIRDMLPNGKEQLVDVVQGGKSVTFG
jgi:hypothetical protein